MLIFFKKFTILFVVFPSLVQASFMTAPIAKKIPFTDTFHNDGRVDNYRWMHDNKDPLVKRHLMLENSYADTYLKKYASIKDDVYNGMVSSRKKLSKVFSFFLPTSDIYLEKKQTENYYHWYVSDKKGSTTKEIFDENSWAKDFSYFRILSFNISPDHSKAMILLDTKGRGQGELFLFDLVSASKTKLKTNYLWESNFIWEDGNNLIFFGAKNEKDVYQLYRYNVSTQTETHVHNFPKQFDGHKRSLYTNLEGKTAFIDLSTFTENTVFEFKNDVLKKILKENNGILNALDEVKGKRFIVSNKDSNNKGIYQLVNNHWNKIYTPASGMISNVHYGETHAVVTISNEGLDTLEIVDLDTFEVQEINLNEKIISINSVKVDKYEGELYYQVASYTQDNIQFKCSLKNCIPKNIDVNPNQPIFPFTAKRINVMARDGVQVPVTLIYGKGGLTGKPKKLYQYGYGSYGSTIRPGFSREYIELIKKGFIIAISHIRGGGVKGKPWHDQGRYFNKLNSFYDFIDISEFLIKNKITTKDQLAIEGRSAGGLLMGTVVNMRPDLYRVAILGVPFVDVLNTMTLYYDPLAKYEKKEWGDGLVKSEYEFIKFYDPYTNIKKSNYPSIYVFTGFEDTAVYYFQPMKWVAKMRELNSPNTSEPVLFDITFKGGHGGGSSQDSGDLLWAKKISFIIGEIDKIAP